MNDATEFASSLAGTLDFFHHLHRKLGVLETETSARIEQLRSVASSVATIQQDQQADRQTLVSLAGDIEAQAGQLATLQSDSRLLDDQLTQLETTVACLQQDRQLVQEALASLASSLRTQNTALRQELESILEQRTAPIIRVVALEEQVVGQSQQLRDLLASLKAQGQDASQARQDLHQQQDRQKHLETLLGKVAADTSSTRQILNVLQTDLTTHGDTLRELDQTWRDGLAAYQDRLSHLETIVAGSRSPLPADGPNPTATAPESPSPTVMPDEPATVSSPFPAEREQLDEPATTIASLRAEQQALVEKLAAVHDTLADQDQHLAGLRNILAEQLQAQRQRLGELQAALDALRQAPLPTTEHNLQPVHEALTAQAGMLDELQRSIRQQLHAQHERLGELELALDTLQQASSAGTATALKPLRDALANHAESLEELRQATQQQIAELSIALETQRLESQGVAERIDDLQRDLQYLQQQPATAPVPITHAHPPRPEADEPEVHELRQNLGILQETVTLLETRLSSQAQAFSGNFEQFQGLSTDIEGLQQQIAKLDPSQRLDALEQGIAAHDYEITRLQDAVQQLGIDSGKISEAVRQNEDRDSRIATLEIRLDEHQEHLARLSATVETIRTDAKATQEQVLIMAGNVAQRLHEFQNQLLAAKTSQGEQLQEMEQKLILLQAMVETLDTPPKTRRWFRMPTTLTTVVFTVGATLLATLAQIIRTVG